MAKVPVPGTSIDEVADAVIAVKELQEQLSGLLKAVTLLTTRVEAIEAAQGGGSGGRKTSG